MKDFYIPPLEAKDIDCRVQSVSKTRNGGVGAVLLLYKDARVDMRMLDLIYGAGNWQRTHEVINGNLFCNLDIWDDEKKCWVRKQDVGVESNTEKEKGQASDAFKRAGFNVGIGRELYSSPFIWVSLSDSEYYSATQGNKTVYRCNAQTRFHVSEIGYDERRNINYLVITDEKGNQRFTYGAKEHNGKLKELKEAQNKVKKALMVLFDGDKAMAQKEWEDYYARDANDIHQMSAALNYINACISNKGKDNDA